MYIILTKTYKFCTSDTTSCVHLLWHILLLYVLTLRLLMSYIYIYIYMEHIFLMFLDHTRRTTVGRTPLDLVISSSQRPLPDNTRHSQQTNIHAPGGIRTQDLSRWAAAGRSPAEIVGSNPRGVLPTVLRRRVWSRNIKNRCSIYIYMTLVAWGLIQFDLLRMSKILLETCTCRGL